MRQVKPGRQIDAVAVTLTLVCLAATSGLACAATSNHSSGGDSEIDRSPPITEEPANEDPESMQSSQSNSRDDAYRDVLSTHERLTATWLDSPHDTEALLAACADLQNDLKALSELAEADAPIQTTRHETEVGRTTVTPSGKATASAEPSSEEAAAARERATDELLGVPIPEAKGAQESLANVPTERVREACAEAADQLAHLEELWRQESQDREAIQAGLSELERILGVLSSPPEATTIDP